MLLNYSDFKCKYLPVKRCSEYGTKKIIDVNNLALNGVYFPNYCLIIKTSISLKVRSIGFGQFAAIKKKKCPFGYTLPNKSANNICYYLTFYSTHEVRNSIH